MGPAGWLPERDEGGGFSLSFTSFAKFCEVLQSCRAAAERPSGSVRASGLCEATILAGARACVRCAGSTGQEAELTRAARRPCSSWCCVRVSGFGVCASRRVLGLCGFNLAVTLSSRRCVAVLAVSPSPCELRALASAGVVVSMRTGRVRTRPAPRKPPASSPVDAVASCSATIVLQVKISRSTGISTTLNPDPLPFGQLLRAWREKFAEVCWSTLTR